MSVQILDAIRIGVANAEAKRRADAQAKEAAMQEAELQEDEELKPLVREAKANFDQTIADGVAKILTEKEGKLLDHEWIEVLKLPPGPKSYIGYVPPKGTGHGSERNNYDISNPILSEFVDGFLAGEKKLNVTIIYWGRGPHYSIFVIIPKSVIEGILQSSRQS